MDVRKYFNIKNKNKPHCIYKNIPQVKEKSEVSLSTPVLK